MRRLVSRYRKSINPPYNRRDILNLIATFSLLLAFPIALYLIRRSESVGIQTSAQAETPLRGITGDLWADTVIGKRDFGEIAPREIVPYKVSAPGGVIIDRSVSPGRMYVWDSGNSRILGIDLAKCYAQSSPCSADLVIGQPSANDYGACNQDASFQNYPNRAPSSTTTVCGIPEWTHTTLEDKSFANMYVDGVGNLYLPDIRNNRVLKFISPFTTDVISDEVWGQTDFSGNKCNLTGGYNQPAPKPTASSLCFSSIGGFGGGVVLDAEGNLWVADGGNNRVLRFAKDVSGNISKTADLVLGQPDFTSGGDYSGGSSLDRMSSPLAVRFDPQGNLYVADSGNKKVLIFRPPFASGMTANGTLGSGFIDGPFGLENDPVGNGLWVLDHYQSTLRLWSFDGNLLETIAAVGHPGGGSIGIDTEGHILKSTYVYGQDVHRFSPVVRDRCSIHDGDLNGCNADSGCAYYSCSNTCWLTGTSNDIACNVGGNYVADKNFFSPPIGYKITSSRCIEHPAWVGVAIAGNQLVVSDARLLFWNDLTSLTNGKIADGYIGTSSFTEIPNPVFEQVKSDVDLKVWVSRKNEIRVYQAPLTSGASPIKTIVSPVNALGGSSLSFNDVHGIAVTSHSEYLWVSEPGNHRVFRIKDPLTNPMVDVVLGQTTLAGNKCNRNLVPAPNTGTTQDADLTMLCYPGALSIDKEGNLYVSDHFLEAQGNWRLLMFAPSLFPTSPSSIIYAPSATKSFPRSSSNNQYTHMTFEPAFDSTNRMLVGNNPYFRTRFIEYYNDPTRVNPANPSDPTYAQPDGQLKDFYGWPVAMAFDSANNLYAYDANRGQIRIYKNPFNLEPPTPTPTPTPLTISNVFFSNITKNSAKVNWTTSAPGTSRVSYGTRSNKLNLSSPLDPTLTTAHAVTLTGLSKSRTYYYQVHSKNVAGVEFSSSTQSFKTTSR